MSEVPAEAAGNPGKNSLPGTEIYPRRDFFSPRFPFAIQLVINRSEEFNRSKRFQRQFWKIVFIVSGEGDFLIGDRQYPIGKGSVMVVHPDARTTYDIRGKSLKLYNLVFDRSFLEPDFPAIPDAFHFLRIFTEPYESDYESPLFLLTATREMHTLIRAIYREFNDNLHSREPLIRLRFYELLLLIVRRSESKGFHNPRWTAAYVKEYIGKYFQAPFSQRKLAAETGLSPERLCRIYREYFSCTITQELRNARLNHAEKMLKTTRLTAAEIGRVSGFGDLRSFYRAFTARHGVPPEKYRETMGEN